MRAVDMALEAALLVMQNGGSTVAADRSFSNVLKGDEMEGVTAVWRLDFVAWRAEAEADSSTVVRPVGTTGVNLSRASEAIRDVCAADASAIRHHHFGMWVDDEAEYAGLRAALAERNIPVVFDAKIPNVGDAIYVDTRVQLGHYLEYVHLIPEVKRRYYADVPQY